MTATETVARAIIDAVFDDEHMAIDNMDRAAAKAAIAATRKLLCELAHRKGAPSIATWLENNAGDEWAKEQEIEL